MSQEARRSSDGDDLMRLMDEYLEPNSSAPADDLPPAADDDVPIGPAPDRASQRPRVESAAPAEPAQSPVFEAAIEIFRRHRCPITPADDLFAVMEFVHLAATMSEARLRDERELEAARARADLEMCTRAIIEHLNDVVGLTKRALADHAVDTDAAINRLREVEQGVTSKLGAVQRDVVGYLDASARFVAKQLTDKVAAETAEARIAAQTVVRTEFNREIRAMVREEVRIGMATGFDEGARSALKTIDGAAARIDRASKIAETKASRGWLAGMVVDIKALIGSRGNASARKP